MFDQQSWFSNFICFLEELFNCDRFVYYSFQLLNTICGGMKWNEIIALIWKGVGAIRNSSRSRSNTLVRCRHGKWTTLLRHMVQGSFGKSSRVLSVRSPWNSTRYGLQFGRHQCQRKSSSDHLTSSWWNIAKLSSLSLFFSFQITRKACPIGKAFTWIVSI